jgi:hypothetical protein
MSYSKSFYVPNMFNNKIIDIIDCTGSDDIKLSVIDKLPDNLTNLENLSKEFINDNTKIYYGIRSLKSFISNRKYNTFSKENKN